MTWVRIDDRAPHHRKLRDAGPDAAWLWVCGLCWCNGQVTDGHIRADDLACLYPGRFDSKRLTALAATLVRLELWHEEPGGWVVHGYAEEQREAMSDRVAARREADRKRKGGRKDSDRNPSGSHDGLPPDSAQLPPSPGPARPGPVSDQNSSRGGSLDLVARGAPGIVEGAYARALGAHGGSYVANPGRDSKVFVALAEAIERMSPNEVLRDASDRLAREWRGSRRNANVEPSYWLEWLQKRAAAGTSANNVSPESDFVPSPITRTA